MAMTRFGFGHLLLVAGLASTTLAACNKPSKDDCRKAIHNMRALMHTEQLVTDIEGEVRRCSGGSKLEAVQCAIKATTLDELRHCKFMSIPESAGSAAPAGSSGSAAAPSATPAAAPDSGSAAPSGTPAAGGSAAAPQ